ncbi:hypothetical protein AAIR98_001128 [Elusimicrobium simillimum]|uniref:hypothetical protein n=1 Tax=Elusimicrobium simillimum TaxID=3143438 RepID=UPI003C6F3D03
MKKIVTIVLSVLLLSNNFIYAQSADTQKPKTLKQYVERAKQDNIKLQTAGGDFSAELFFAVTITALATRFIVKEGLSYYLKKTLTPDALMWQKDVHATKELIKEALDYTVSVKDIELRNLLQWYGSKEKVSYSGLLSLLEDEELGRNINALKKAEPLAFKNMPENSFRIFKNCIIKLERLKNEFYSGKVTVEMLREKEALYAELKTTGYGANILRLRSAVFNHANKTPGGRVVNAYLDQEILSFEQKFLKKYSSRRIKILKNLNKFLLVGILLTAVVSADAATEGKINRIENNFSLIFQADDATIKAIEQKKELTELIKVIFDEHHEAALATAAEQAEYKKEFENKKKQINFNTRNNKFTSAGVKSGR